MRQKYKQAPLLPCIFCIQPLVISLCVVWIRVGYVHSSSVESRWPCCGSQAEVSLTRLSRARVRHASVTRHVATSVDACPKLPRMNRNNDEPKAGMQLLASVRYFLSSSLPQDWQDDLRQVLDSNGATPAVTLKDANHTHCCELASV